MTDEDKEWQAETTYPDGAAPPEDEDLIYRVEHAEQHARQLAQLLRGSHRQVELLGEGIALTVALHSAWRTNAESEMEGLCLEIAALREHLAAVPPLSPPAGNVNVTLPYTTHQLRAVFEVMRDVSKSHDGRHPPKSMLIALAIDDRLGMKHQRNGDASRSAQAIASLIRPDSAHRSDASGGRRGGSDGRT